MNKLLLYLIMLPSVLWKGMGADLGQLRAILWVKLLMDDRKPLNIGRQRSGKKQNRFTSVLTVVLSFFTGIIYMLPLLFTLKDAVFGLCIFYTLFILFLTFTLITDFSNAMVDTRDKHILFSRPINDRTIFLSRMLHILIYLVRIVIPMSLPGWIAFAMIKGWKAALWFPFPLLLMIFIALFLVNAVYLLIVRLAKPGKFKEIISYFQILFSILFFASYYLLPQFMDNEVWENLDIAAFGWLRWLPSYWLAATWVWVEPSAATLSGTGWLGVLALVFPVVCLWATVRYLAPSFIKRISAQDGIEPDEPATVSKKQNRRSLVYALAGSMNRSDAAKAGFIMTWIQTSRSRSFKMRVFPLFAYVPVYFLYLLVINDEKLSTVWQGLPDTNKHLTLLYMSAFVILQSLNYIILSDQYKAAWVYHAAPLPVPGHVLGGAFKAMWVKYFLPFIAFIGIFVLWVWGAAAIVDVLLAMVNVTLFAMITMRLAYRIFPFSMLEQMNSGGKSIFRVVLTLLLISTLGFGHYLASFMWWLKYIFLLLAIILLWLVWDSYHNTRWSDMKASEEI